MRSPRRRISGLDGSGGVAIFSRRVGAQRHMMHAPRERCQLAPHAIVKVARNAAPLFVDVETGQSHLELLFAGARCSRSKYTRAITL